MNDILSNLKKEITARNNTLRFDCALSMEAGIRVASTELQACRFVRNTFIDMPMKATLAIVRRVRAGESLTTVTNELNSNSLL